MKTILIIILSLNAIILFAPSANWKVRRIEAKEIYLSLHEAYKLIRYHESRNDSTMYNAREDACGDMQTRKVMIREANRISGYEKYSLADRWSSKKSREIFFLVQKHHNRGKKNAFL